MEEANEFLWIIQQSEFRVVEQLNKTPARVSLLELLMSSEIMIWFCSDVWTLKKPSECQWRYMKSPLGHILMGMPWPG